MEPVGCLGGIFGKSVGFMAVLAFWPRGGALKAKKKGKDDLHFANRRYIIWFGLVWTHHRFPPLVSSVKQKPLHRGAFFAKKTAGRRCSVVIVFGKAN